MHVAGLERREAGVQRGCREAWCTDRRAPLWDADEFGATIDTERFGEPKGGATREAGGVGAAKLPNIGGRDVTRLDHPHPLHLCFMVCVMSYKAHGPKPMQCVN